MFTPQHHKTLALEHYKKPNTEMPLVKGTRNIIVVVLLIAKDLLMFHDYCNLKVTI